LFPLSLLGLQEQSVPSSEISFTSHVVKDRPASSIVADTSFRFDYSRHQFSEAIFTSISFPRNLCHCHRHKGCQDARIL